MCCEQLWFLLHERFVFEVDGLLCQPHPVTARWIFALANVGSISWGSGPRAISAIMSHRLEACRVGSQGLRAVQSTRVLFVTAKSLSRVCVSQPRTVRSTPFWFLSLFAVSTHVKPAVDALHNASYAVKLSCQVPKPTNGIHTPLVSMLMDIETIITATS